MIVLDASFLTDFLLGRPASVDALLAETASSQTQPLHAPELIEPEVINALRGLVRARRIELSRAEEALTDFASLRLIRYPHAPLRERVWQLRDSLTAYDASYLALAEGLEAPVLFAGDRGLADVATRTLGESQVRLVS